MTAKMTKQSLIGALIDLEQKEQKEPKPSVDFSRDKTISKPDVYLAQDYDPKEVFEISELGTNKLGAQLLYHVAKYAINEHIESGAPLSPFTDAVSVTLPHTVCQLLAKTFGRPISFYKFIKGEIWGYKSPDWLIGRSSAYHVRSGRALLTAEELEGWRKAFLAFLLSDEFAKEVSSISKVSQVSTSNISTAEESESSEETTSTETETTLEESSTTFKLPRVLQAEAWTSENFGKTLLEEARSLCSGYPLVRVAEWSDLYGEGSDVTFRARVVPTAAEYVRNAISAWRSCPIVAHDPKMSFLDILGGYTKSRRMSRGFHKMVQVLHTGMRAFNSRISYPLTNLVAYKKRYREELAETGLTAEILMAYCLFCGLHPMSLLTWLARREKVVPSRFEVRRAVTPEDFILWRGTVSPHEHDRFLQMIINMGLVSDQKAWAYGLLSARFVYRDLPTEESIKARIAPNEVSQGMIDEVLATWPQPETNSDIWDYDSGLGLDSETNPAVSLLETFGLEEFHDLTELGLNKLKVYAAIGAASQFASFSVKVETANPSQIIAEAEAYLGRLPTSPLESETYGEYKVAFSRLIYRLGSVYLGIKLARQEMDSDLEDSLEDSDFEEEEITDSDF